MTHIRSKKTKNRIRVWSVAFTAAALLGVLTYLTQKNETSPDQKNPQEVFVSSPVPDPQPSSTTSTGETRSAPPLAPAPFEGQVESLFNTLNRSELVLVDQPEQGEDGRFERRRIYRTELPPPMTWIRIEELVQGSKNSGEKILQRKIMVADHMLATLATGASQEQLSQYLSNHGARVRSQVPGTQTFTIEFDGSQSFDQMQRVLEALQQSGIVLTPEPDYIAVVR